MTQISGNIIKQQGIWRLHGAMDVSQVESLLEQADMTGVSGDLIVDLSEVSDVDTASVSLLMEWLRQARKHKCNLQYKNPPKNLIALASLYEVLEMIPITAN